MKILTGLIISAVTFGLSTHTFAQAEVEIVWDKPEKYRDVKPSNESRKKFREATFERLDKYLNKLATALPDDKKLLMQVSDLDLAGQVWPASFVGMGHSSSDVRVIKDIDIPRMTFSYQLLDKSGQVVQQASVNLKDMAFLNRSNHLFKSEPLRYEKNMLKNWFEQEFELHIDQKVADKDAVNSNV